LERKKKGCDSGAARPDHCLAMGESLSKKKLASHFFATFLITDEYSETSQSLPPPPGVGGGMRHFEKLTQKNSAPAAL